MHARSTKESFFAGFFQLRIDRSGSGSGQVTLSANNNLTRIDHTGGYGSIDRSIEYISNKNPHVYPLINLIYTPLQFRFNLLQVINDCVLCVTGARHKLASSCAFYSLACAVLDRGTGEGEPAAWGWEGRTDDATIVSVSFGYFFSRNNKFEHIGKARSC